MSKARMTIALSVRARANDLIGVLLCDKWRVRRVLGLGGMSTVYEAVHRNGNRVAIKVLHPELSHCPRTRRRFLREGYVANRVGHPGAVAVVDDVVTAEGLVFLVMELLEGESLGARLRRLATPLPPREVLAITDCALDVLACAHARGIVHRDIKPDNMFITHGGSLKVLDFGIARVRDLIDLGADVTGSGSLLGTPAFMAPEQARSTLGDVDPRTDLWALGATMFTLLTGRHVHQGPSSHDVLIAAGTEPADSIGIVSPNLDPHLVEVVDRALRFDKQQRWADARSMQRALKELAGGEHQALPSVPAHCVEVEALATPWATATRSNAFSESGHQRKSDRAHRLIPGALLGSAALVALVATIGWTRYSRFAPPLADSTAPPPIATAPSSSPEPIQREQARGQDSTTEPLTADVRTAAAANAGGAEAPQTPAVAVAKATVHGGAARSRERPAEEATPRCKANCEKPASASVNDPLDESPQPHRLVPRDPMLDRRD
jgi:serine/threonine-protein kinase